MRPAEGEHSRTTLPVQRLDILVGTIAVALDDAGEVAKQPFRPDFLATGHVGVDDRRWIGATMRAIIMSDRSEISRLHLAGAGCQHLGGGLIDEQPGTRQEVSFHPAGQAPEAARGSPRSVAHGSPVDFDTPTHKRLRLAIEGHVIGIFLDQSIGDHSLSGQAALHHMLGRGRLEHPLASSPARHFGRDVTITRYWTGVTSSRLDMSLSMQCSASPQQGHSFSSGRITFSTRVRCAGSDARAVPLFLRARFFF